MNKDRDPIATKEEQWLNWDNGTKNSDPIDTVEQKPVTQLTPQRPESRQIKTQNLQQLSLTNGTHQTKTLDNYL